MKNLLLQKVDAILKTLAVQGQISMNELSSALNIPLPTLSRVVSDLMEMKLVEKIDYHHLTLGTAMIRYGECCRSHNPLPAVSIPRITAFAEELHMSVLMAAYDDGMMFPLYSRIDPQEQHPLGIWESGLALVLMTEAGLPQDECLELYRQNQPDTGVAGLLIFERELDNVKANRRLFRVNTMRLWSCSMPLKSKHPVCGICFYGKAPADRTMERFSFDCTRLMARLNSSLDRE